MQKFNDKISYYKYHNTAYKLNYNCLY